VLLTLTPTDPEAAKQPPVAIVGKGIVYDTGGLNLKGNGGRGMKDDMSGSGAVLGAFQYLATAAAAGQELAAPLVAALCLAENSIGPDAYRPDDILTMHSGKTVEVDNTDAEGRFVVGDGCSWCARELGAKVVIDAATLTGHSSFTGKTHAAAMASDGPLEQLAVAAGLSSGEHVVPMVFLPEAQGAATSSPVADMSNTGRSAGMGSAIGGYFIYAQVADVPGIRWLHIDLGDPVGNFGLSGRATAYGVGLLSTLVEGVLSSREKGCSGPPWIPTPFQRFPINPTFCMA